MNSKKRPKEYLNAIRNRLDNDLNAKSDLVYESKELIEKERNYYEHNYILKTFSGRYSIMVSLCFNSLETNSEVVHGDITIDLVTHANVAESLVRKHLVEVMRIIMNTIEYNGFCEAINRELKFDLSNIVGHSTLGGVYAYTWEFGKDTVHLSFGGDIKLSNLIKIL